MKELQSLLTEASKIKAELKRLDEMEANARSAIISATDEDVTTPAAQQRIADARLTLEVVSARRSKLKPPFSAVHKRLRDEFKTEGNRWNAAVEAARLATEKELVSALLPFWLGDEKFMRKTLGPSLLAPTVFDKYRRALFNFPYHPDPAQQDLVGDVRRMIDHFDRHQKALGIEG